MIAAHWQTALFALAAIGITAVQALFDPSLPAQVLILAPLVAILGLPHGALDLPIAEALWPLQGPARQAMFAALYLGLSGAVVAVWLLLPGLALLAFLAYAMLHFSEDWAEGLPALRWSGGLATVGAPALLHHAEVEAIFAMLAQRGAVLAADAAALAGIAGLAVLAVSLLTPQRVSVSAVLEQLVLWATATFLPPLMYFAVYFCALHSVRHFTSTMRAVPHGRRALGIALVLSLIVTLVALVPLRLGITGTLAGMTEQGLRVIFIGLAALTVPHMILVDRFRRADITTD
ncbi:MAG: Brp/Blh family beta-carotene 15,15'-dioxygenase [Roseovarius sp.]|nr:Brp/Blh family beta-carotene 15,15'-dioxygenase [Roseovarius sp.]